MIECNMRRVLMGVLIACAVPAFGQDSKPAPRTMAVDQMSLNFQDVTLQTVLDYMSKAGGFVILGKPQVSGKVTVFSHQPLNRDEAVNLLNTILAKKGYAAVRNGRVLEIVKQTEAKSHNLPVKKGSDPAKIPSSDEMVTQIIPIRHSTAAELIANIKPLLASHSNITSNKTSNAIVITDTQKNIKRIAAIVHALDTSISDISTVKVFPLKYGDAESIAKIITDTFKSTATTSNSGNNRRVPFFMRGRGGGTTSNTSASPAQKAATHVSAVGDMRGNNVVVNAPAEAMGDIGQLIKELDVPTEETSVIRVYPLKYADAEQMAKMVAGLFVASTNNDNNNRNNGGRRRWQPQSNSNNSTTTRTLKEGQVTAVADTRTNSVIVTASPARQTEIKDMLAKLDSGPSRSPRVYVYKVKHADLEKLKELLEGMFDDLENLTPTNTAGVQGFNTRNTNTRQAGNSRR